MIDKITLSAIGEVLKEERILTDADIQTVKQVLTDCIIVLGDKTGKDLKSATDGLKSTVDELVGGISDSIDAKIGAMNEAIDVVAGAMSGKVSGVEERSKSALNEEAESLRLDIKLAKTHAIETLKEELGATLVEMKDLVADVDSTVRGTIQEFLDVSADKISQLESGKDGVDGQDGSDGQTGAAGRDSDPEDVARQLVGDEDFQRSVTGAKGETGKAGEAGADRTLIEPRHIEDGDRLKKNEIVYWKGGLFQTTRKTIGSPDKDPQSYKSIVVGIDELHGEQDKSNRVLKLTAKMSDGGTFEIDLNLPAGYQPPEKGVMQLDGDFYLDGSLVKTFKNGKWDSIDLTGDKGGRGRKGMKGDRGISGVGIEEVFLVDGLMTILMTDGETKEFLLDLIQGQNQDIQQEIRSYQGIYKFDTTYAAGDVVTAPQGLFLALKKTKALLSDIDAWALMFGKEAGLSGGGGSGLGVTMPVDMTIVQKYIFNPVTASMGWVDARLDLQVVDTVAELSNRAILPQSHMEVGKLVYVRSTGQLFEQIHDMAHLTNKITDWKEAGGTGGVKYAGRVMNLPDPKTTAKPADGSLYVIEMDFEGKPYHRLVSWDNSIIGAYQTVNVKPKAHVPADIIADATALSTLFTDTHPATDEGRFWTIERPEGETPKGGEPYAGQFLPTGTKLIWLGNNKRGVSGWAIAPADTGYTDVVNTPPKKPIELVVDDRSLPKVTGGWRWLDRMNWVHALNSQHDHTIDNRIGDFQTTIEKAKHNLKVFDGASWITLFSEEEIKTWIASLALFRGTVSEDSAKHVGTLALGTLPDLSAMSTAGDVSNTGRYWIWQGAIPFAVTPTTDRIGTDLDGAGLQVGDWLVVSNRGGDGTVPGDTAGTIHSPVDLHWVRVGGDILTATRGRALFGLNPWVDGAYETGSLVSHEGDLWKAREAIVAGDNEPGVGSGVTAPSSGEAIRVTNALDPIIIDDATLDSAINTVPVPVQWVSYPIIANFTPTAASNTGWDGIALLNGGSLIWTGFPTLNYNDGTGIHIVNGWMLAPDEITSFTVDAPLAAAIAVLAAGNKWSLVPVGGGLRWVPMDTDLPATGNVGDAYLVVTSTRAHGNPAIYTWDTAQTMWVSVAGSGGGLPLDFAGGEIIYPRNFITDAGEADPGQFSRIAGDLLITRKVTDAQRYVDSVCDAAGHHVKVGAHLLRVGTTGEYPDIAGQIGDIVIVPKSVNIPARTFVHDGTSWNDISAGGIDWFSQESIDGYAWSDHGWHQYATGHAILRDGMLDRWIKTTIQVSWYTDRNSHEGIIRAVFGGETQHLDTHGASDSSLHRTATFTFFERVTSLSINFSIHIAWASGGALRVNKYKMIVEDIGFR